VDGSTISANTAYTGGGILNSGTLYVQNGSTVSANTATTDGGGIYNKAMLYVQNGSTIGGAGAGNTALRGGGIYNVADFSAGITTVDGSTVSANGADYGGGIHNEAGWLLVQNGSTIGGAGAGNQADYGGGIYNWTGATMVSGSTVSANTAIYGGGGISNDGTLTVQNGSTIGGTGSGNTAGYGGGISNEDGTTMVTGSRILNNLATTNGGGVFNEWNVAWATSVTGSCIVGNSATSFFNNQSAQQTATGNWWGAATGPNTPGADTVGGSVDTSGYLTEPILGCSFELTVSRDGTGYGSVSSTPAGIVCGTDCSETYNYGTVVTLIATADTGSTFTGWSGACSGTAACVVTMDAAKSVTATFMVTVYDVFLPIIMK